MIDRVSWRSDLSRPPRGGFVAADSLERDAPWLSDRISRRRHRRGAAHGVNSWRRRLIGTAFPFATLFENVTGSLVMGLLAAYFAFKGDASQHWRLFLTTGILGGYTTFSASRSTPRCIYERGELAHGALRHRLRRARTLDRGLFAGLAIVRGMT